MKYLVTGSTGLLGNNIVRQLLAEGESVRVLARKGSDERPLKDLDVEVAPGDVRDEAAVREACQGVDVVVHSAGLVHIGWSQEAEQRQINVEGTRHVAAKARELGARLVHVSSVNALGLGRRDAPADEEIYLPGIVDCPYVVTKREAEKVVQEEVSRGLQATIVNPGFMLGPWDWKPSSGRMLLEVAKFAPLAPIGACSLCDVRDVTAGVVAAARSTASGRRFILAGHNLSYFEMWRHFARLAGSRGPRFRAGPLMRWIGAGWGDMQTRVTGREPNVNSAGVRMSSQDHCFSSARAQSELGYEIRPLDETVSAAWQWFRENGYVK